MSLLRRFLVDGGRHSLSFVLPTACRATAKTGWVAIGSAGAASFVAVHSHSIFGSVNTTKSVVACDSAVADVPEQAPQEATDSHKQIPDEANATRKPPALKAQDEHGHSSESNDTELMPTGKAQPQPGKKLAALSTCFGLIGNSAALLLVSIVADIAAIVCKLKRPLAESQAAHCIGNIEAFRPALWRAFVLMVLEQMFHILQSYFKEKALDGFQCDLERKMLISTLQQDAEFFDLSDPAALANRIHEDASAVRNFVGQLTSRVMGLVLSIGGGLREIYALSPSLMCKMTVFSVPLVAYFSTALAVWMRARKAAAASKENRNTGLVESLTNIRTVHTCGAEEVEILKYGRRTKDLASARNWERTTGRVMWNSAGFVSNALHLSLLYMGSRNVQEGNMNDADVGALFKQTFNLMGSVGHLVGLSQSLSSGIASVESAVAAINRVPAVSPQKGQALDATAFVSDMVFNSVSFHYPSRPDDGVLNNVTCRIPSGQVTAFVGRSGSGKSTMGLLSQRTYDPGEGNICVGGINLREVSPQCLRQGISYVEQEPKLFEGTIRENIHYGHHLATASEVESAADAAGVTGFASTLPSGLDTGLGKFGKGLSGGQKQRVAIARALLKQPRILILDEATSALDVSSEMRLLSVLSERLRNSTVIVIAHRLSTVRNAEQIIVMEQGAVVEAGSHNALCANPEGVYARLVQQSSGQVF